eukprot:TRINITY_DN29529_c0_g1_i1.p1 TRINITY_DN29529_c0_g1~~TRINITY_DN29529_c0_g1_i1.p1  ORF type:complete len:239 (-),score=39.66 TRINITY_DN29529_c0_g1_i1:135-770(-)
MAAVADERLQSPPSLLKKKQNPLKAPIRFVRPRPDSSGAPTVRLRMPLYEADWDNSPPFAGGSENTLKPKQMRNYFSSAGSLPRAPPSRGSSRAPSRGGSVAEGYEAFDPQSLEDELPSQLMGPGGPRHRPGGTMRDWEGNSKTWNNRWHASISRLNENLHPMHRTGFSQPSLFEAAPSQRWRRYLDSEEQPGEWREISFRRDKAYGPMGV